MNSNSDSGLLHNQDHSDLCVGQLDQSEVLLVSPCRPLPQLCAVVQCCVGVVVDKLLGAREGDVGLETRVFQLQQPVQVAHSVQTPHVDPVRDRIHWITWAIATGQSEGCIGV